MNWRYPLLKLWQAIRRPRRRKYLREYERYYRLPAQEQQRLQEQRLVALLKHSAEHVPYYRSVLRECGVYANGEIALSLFGQIPALTRGTIAAKFDQLKSDDLKGRRWYANATSGSTGEPSHVIQDQNYFDATQAYKLWHYEQLGKREGDTHIKLWGQLVDLEWDMGEPWSKVQGFFRNHTWLNSYVMSEAIMADYVAQIQRIQPVLLEAYANSAFELAKYINSNSIPVSGVGAIITSATRLLPHMREEIERAFHCTVFDRYGSREVGDIAIELKRGGPMAVNSYNVVVEVLDERGEAVQAGQTGEILVTSLSNYAMPLIRYRIGDLGVPAEAPKAETHHVRYLKTAIGRVDDTFITPDGKMLDGLFLVVPFRGLAWVKQYQIVQEDINWFRITIEPHDTRAAHAQNIEQIWREMKKLLGEDCRVEVKMVDTFPAGPAGKHRYLISKVHSRGHLEER